MQWRLLESNLRFVPETIDFRPLHAVARGRGLHTDMRSRWLISNPAVFFDTVNAKLDRVGLARRRRTNVKLGFAYGTIEHQLHGHKDHCSSQSRWDGCSLNWGLIQ
jgi:hypothetical protein